jgi:transcriptional regulator of heat shock response
MRTTNWSDFRQRKDLILGLVVNQYVKTMSPVSSAYIAQEYLQDLSPATIRNILAELEEEGYLTHPHISAGRIPTQEGYRYFVDFLMDEIMLLEVEKQRIKKEYEQSVRDLETYLEKTSHVLSDLTHYTSIISVDGRKDRLFFCGTNYVVGYPEYQDIRKIQQILIALEEKEHLYELLNRELNNKVKIYIGHEMAYENISDTCSLAVSGYKTMRGDSGRIAILGPTRMDYPRVVSALEYMSNLLEEVIC